MINNLTLLIPVKNEKESLGIFLKKLSKFNYKTILVVDKYDDTDYLKIVKKLSTSKFICIIRKTRHEKLNGERRCDVPLSPLLRTFV